MFIAIAKDEGKNAELKFGIKNKKRNLKIDLEMNIPVEIKEKSTKKRPTPMQNRLQTAWRFILKTKKAQI